MRASFLAPDEIDPSEWPAEIARRREMLFTSERYAFDLVVSAYPDDDQNRRLSLTQLASLIDSRQEPLP